MSTSAKVTYSAVQSGPSYNYEVVLTNTSPAPFDIYSFMFGAQWFVPNPNPAQLQDIVLISAPPGWTGSLGGFPSGLIIWGTSFQNGSNANGYIKPGDSGTFTFLSTTPPPATLLFGCGFYDNNNVWGYTFNGTATEGDLIYRKPFYYAYINPLVLILGDEVFARINLPRPPTYTPSLEAQLTPQIRKMLPGQRETAVKALDADIAALTKVRALLREV